MRLRSWLLIGIGYLAGSRAGRERFEDLKTSLATAAESDIAMAALDRARVALGLEEPLESDEDASGDDVEEDVDVDDEDEDEDEDGGGEGDEDEGDVEDEEDD